MVMRARIATAGARARGRRAEGRARGGGGRRARTRASPGENERLSDLECETLAGIKVRFPIAPRSVWKDGDLGTLEAFATFVKSSLRDEFNHLSGDPLEYALTDIRRQVLLHENDKKNWHLRPLALEFGFGEGEALRLMSRYLGDLGQLGQSEGSRIVVFDSFDSLPEDWILDLPWVRFSKGGVPEELDGAYIIPGLFHDTLPQFFNVPHFIDDDLLNEPEEESFVRLTRPILRIDPRYPTKLVLVHIGRDLHSSTATIFKNLQRGLRNSKIMTEPVTKFRKEKRAWFYLAFDEFIGDPGAELIGHSEADHAMKAFYEFMLDNPELSFEVVGVDGRTVQPDEPCVQREPCPHWRSLFKISLLEIWGREPCPHRALFKIWGPE